MSTNLEDNFTLMTRDDLTSLGIKYANSTLIEHEKKGQFPKRITLSTRRVAWIRAEVDQWFRQKMDERLEADHD